jgi:hypothetical protein
MTTVRPYWHFEEAYFASMNISFQYAVHYYKYNIMFTKHLPVANGGHFDAIYRCFSICFYKWPSLAGRWLEIFICDVVRNKGLMHVKYFFCMFFSILLTLFKSSPNEMSNRGRHVPLVTETRVNCNWKLEVLIKKRTIPKT